MHRHYGPIALALVIALCVFSAPVYGQTTASSSGGIPSRLQTVENLVDLVQSRYQQLVARLEAVEASALKSELKFEVREAQFSYNRLFDRCIAYGSLVSRQDATYSALLNSVIDHFCPDNEFEGWRAWFGGVIAGTVPMTRAELLARYDNYCGGATGFKNVSRHIVTNDVPTPFIGEDGRQYAFFNGSIQQFDFQASMPNVYQKFNAELENYTPIPASFIRNTTAGWNMNLGWYGNLWLKQANGRWCIKSFDAFTSNLQIMPAVSLGQSGQIHMN